jgi:hypothetical protein
MAVANPKSPFAMLVSAAWDFVRPADAGPPSVNGYWLDYSEPSQKALNAVDPEMKGYIARSTVVSIEGEL